MNEGGLIMFADYVIQTTSSTSVIKGIRGEGGVSGKFFNLVYFIIR